MKICFKLIKAGSGSDTWTFQIASSLRAKGIDVKIEEFPHFYQYFPWLLNTNVDPDVDIIHSNSWYSFIFKKSNVPVLTTEHLVVHDELVKKHKSFAQRIFHQVVYKFEKWGFSSASKITAVSNYTASKVEEIFKFKPIPIQNGIDTEFFETKPVAEELHPEASGKIKLLFVGNFTPRKGADLLPKIMDKLDDRFVLFATAGLQNKEVQEHSKIIPIGKLNQEELVAYYNYCDVFVFPTRLEGLSLVTLEAMACGMPVVTSNCFSMPELIVDGQGGALCEVDNLNSFCRGIEEIASDPDKIKEFGRFNRKRVLENFTLDQMTNKYIEVYRDMLTQKRQWRRDE